MRLTARSRAIGALMLLLVSGLVPAACTCGRRNAATAGRGSAVVVVDPEEVGRPRPDPEREPNDTSRQAQGLPRERGIEGSLPAGDRDWFKVTIEEAQPAAGPSRSPVPHGSPGAAVALPTGPAAGEAPALASSRPASAPAGAPAAAEPPRPFQVLSATLSGVAGADLVLEAFAAGRKRGQAGGAARERLIHINNRGPGEGEVMVNLAVEPGTIYLLVREARGAAVAGLYRLTWSLRPAEEGEEREPNYKAALASPLSLQGEATGYLGWKTDTDWYRVAVEGLEPGARLRVEYDGVDEVRASLSVRTAQAVLQERRGGAGEAVTLSNLAVRSDQKELFVVVRTQSSFNVESRYSVRVVSSTPPGATEAEPNDRPDSATPITMGAALRGLLGDTQDRDVFALAVNQPGVVRAEVTPPLNLDAALALLDDTGQVVWEVDAGAAREVEVLPFVGVKPPRALFQVRAPRAASLSPVTPYLFKVTAVGEGSFEREPNADFASATAWPVTAEQMQGTIHPRGDVDWYRLAAAGERLRLRGEGGKLKLKLELFGVDASPRATAVAGASGVVQLDQPVEAGAELLLRVSDTSNAGRSLEPYKLTREKP